MKKYTFIFVLALLLLFGTAASAQEEPCMAMTVGQNTIYIGQHNYIFSTDRSAPLCNVAASSLLYADNVRLVFRSQHNLMQLDLTGGQDAPAFIDAIAVGGVFVPQDGMVYYVSESDDASLRGFCAVRGTSDVVADLAHELNGMYSSLDGLVAETAGGELLFVPATGEFVEYATYTDGVTAQVHDSFETLLNANGELSLRAKGQRAGESIAIDGGVSAVTALDGMVYYLKQNGEHIALYDYSYATQQAAGLSAFASPLLPQLGAAGGSVYALGSDGTVYALNANTHVVKTFAELVPMPVDPILVATADQLLVYSATSGAELTFVESIPTTEAELPIVQPIEPSDPVEDPVAPEKKKPAEPAEPEVLQRGSRGDDVLTLQTILHNHKYPVGKPDGIFGSGTADAVKYLQYDLGRAETGAVNVSFLPWLKQNCPQYHVYVRMERGDNGIRVYDLQVRLKKLGYLSATPNGNYGPQTEAAVKLFEKAMSEKETGVATAKVAEQIFSKNAVKAWDAFSDIKDPSEPVAVPTKTHHYNGVIDEDLLTSMVNWMSNHIPGKEFSNKSAVLAVQNRLCDLGFLKKSHISNIYDDSTLRAMKRFQDAYNPDDKPTGIPDKRTMELLYPSKLF